jgi:hypothetical protein
VVDRGPAGAGAGEDLAQCLGRDFDVLAEIYRKLLVDAVDDKIKQVLFLYLTDCFGLLRILPKQTLPLTRCDRLIRIIAISYPRGDTERAFQCTNEPIVDGDAEKSRNNPYEYRARSGTRDRRRISVVGSEVPGRSQPMASHGDPNRM